MDVLGLLSSEFACSRLLGLLGGVVAFTALSVVLEVLRVMGDIDVVLSATSVGLVGGGLTIRQAPYSTILG
jgi:hypothetical protein